MPNRPPYHGFNVWGNPVTPGGQPGPTYDQHALRAAQLGGNVLRLPLYWSQFQTGPAPTYDDAPLAAIRAHVQAARAHNPNVKVLLIMTSPVPPWLQQLYPNQISNSHNPRVDPSTGATDALGYFGLAVAEALNRMVGWADVVELYNEPNSTGGGPPINPTEYGDLAAYAAFWVWNCLRGSPPLNPNAHVAAGALSMNDTDIHYYTGYLSTFLDQMCTRLTSLDSQKAGTINQDVRISLHPYPNLFASNVGNAIQKVKDKTNAVVSIGGGGRRYWVTETAGSSAALGEAGQQTFAINISTWMGGWSAIEAMLWWPFSDYDPLASNPNDPTGFYRTGVIRNDNTYKPAAFWFAFNWP